VKFKDVFEISSEEEKHHALLEEIMRKEQTKTRVTRVS
jgi:hypothetical protein